MKGGPSRCGLLRNNSQGSEPAWPPTQPKRSGSRPKLAFARKRNQWRRFGHHTQAEGGKGCAAAAAFSPNGNLARHEAPGIASGSHDLAMQILGSPAWAADPASGHLGCRRVKGRRQKQKRVRPLYRGSRRVTECEWSLFSVRILSCLLSSSNDASNR